MVMLARLRRWYSPWRAVRRAMLCSSQARACQSQGSQRIIRPMIPLRISLWRNFVTPKSRTPSLFPRGWPNTAQRAMPRRRLPTRYRHRSWRFRSFPFEALRALSCKAEGKASTPTTPVQSLSESRSDEPRTRAVVSRLAAAVTSYMYSVSV